jgi:P4 family phage/plasmid primase-like protien
MIEITASSSLPALNNADIRRFLGFLDGEKEVFNYALFDLDTKNPIPGAGICFGTVDEIIQHIEGVPDSTLHVTLNRTKLSGRKNKDVESCRVACADIDNPVSDDLIRQIVAESRPQLVVRSSPSRYHMYWRLSESVTLPEWGEIQMGIAWEFQGDLNLPNLGHLIRVPGVPRKTKDGSLFTPVIVFHDAEDPTRYTFESLQELIPGLAKGIEAAGKAEKAKRERVRKGTLTASPDLDALAIESNRNETLYSVVRNAAFLSAEEPDYEYAAGIARDFNEALRKLNPKGGLDLDELERTAESALEAALEARGKQAERRKAKAEKVKEIQEVAALNGHGHQHTNGHMNGAWEDYDFAAHEIALCPYSEEAMVERVLQRFGEKIVRLPLGLYAFDEESKAWMPQGSKNITLISSFVKHCIDDVIGEEGFGRAFAASKDGIDPSKLLGAVLRWKSDAKMNAIIGALEKSKEITKLTLADFDKESLYFFCGNGLLNLISGELRQVKAEDYLLKCSSKVSYDPTADYSWWDGFLRQVFRDNEDPLAVISFLQEVFGYSLTGETTEQMIFIHYGGGSNGKSRVLSALAAITGGYLGRMQPDSLGTKKNAVAKAMERIGVKAEGRRVVLIDDLDTALEWNEGLIKGLTEKVVIARNLFEEEREVVNTAKLHISCNEIPKVQNSSHAVYRRIAILEYARRFEVSPSKYRDIEEGIEAHKSGILRWAMEGLQRIKSRDDQRILYPAEVRHSVEEYEESNSGMERKMLLCLKVDETRQNWKPIQEIFTFLEGSGELPISELERMGLSGLGAMLSKSGAGRRRVRSAGKEKETQYSVIFKEREVAARMFGVEE